MIQALVLARAPSRTFAPFIAIITLVALTAASCDEDQSEIGIGAAGRGDVVEIVDAPATVTARAAATLSAPADGTLVAMAVKPGDRVGAGQVLAIVDSPTAQDRLADAAAALAALKGGGGPGVRDLSGTQRRTDEAAAKAFAAARDAAAKIVEENVRAALLAQVDAAERAYQEAATSARAYSNSSRPITPGNDTCNVLGNRSSGSPFRTRPGIASASRLGS